MIPSLLAAPILAFSQPIEVGHYEYSEKTKMVKIIRSTYLSGTWSQSEQILKGIDYVKFPGSDRAVCNHNEFAFGCSRNGHNGVMVVNRSGQSIFFPVEEIIYGMEFSPDSKTLILQAYKSPDLPKDLTCVVDLTNRSRPRVHKMNMVFSSFTSKGMASVADNGIPQVWRDNKMVPAPDLAGHLSALLHERKSIRVLPKGAYRQRQNQIPGSGVSYTAEYAISPTLKTMLEMSNISLGTKNNERESIDGTNSFAEDAIFQAGKGTIWKIIRPEGWPYLGKQLSDTKFRFMTLLPLQMGKSSMRKYGSGIYEANLKTQRVERLAPVPPGLAKNTRQTVWSLVPVDL